ncbi:MAG: rhomboid family intramembrane serine protease [Actinomycetota bacterium]
MSTSHPAPRRRLLKLPGSDPTAPDNGLEPPFDPTSWTGALTIMAGLAGLLYVVEAFDAAGGHRLDRFGLRPRMVDGLEGIVTAPFLHAGWWHLISNTGPFVLLGWVLLLSGLRTFLTVTALVALIGGAATWALAPAGLIVGVSGVIFGWLGYLIARAFFARRVLWIVAAVLVAFFFSGLFAGLLPTLNSNVSWQGHVFGFAAGVFAGWLLHPRAPRRVRPASVS